MRIASINEVIRGKLLNLPVVTTFSSVVFEAKKVARGDLIFLSDISELDLAVSKGAFVVVCEQPIAQRGSEVAFIEVANLHEAIVRLLRFFVAHKDIDLFVVEKATIDLANAFIKDIRLLATTDPKLAITTLQNSEVKPVMLVDQALKNLQIKEIDLMPRELKVASSTICSITLADLFMTIQVSPYFLDNLNFIYALSRKYNLSLKFHAKDVALSRFECVRFDDKLLLFDNTRNPQDVMEFLRIQAPWAEAVMFDGDDMDLIAKEIKFRYFQYAYLNNIDKREILNRLNVSGGNNLFQ